MTLRNRRTFIRNVGSLSLATAFSSLQNRIAGATESLTTEGYGPLRPVADESTGIKLLSLPEGFRYRSFGWTGDMMADGQPTPSDHDGMGAVSVEHEIVTIVRNHEISKASSPLRGGSIPFDPKAGGGCVSLRFNQKTGEWLDSITSLTGTVKNCAGGVTPWGTWLSCEETVIGPGGTDDGEAMEFEETHGWNFEVTDKFTERPLPLKAMGRFKHEAVAFDEKTGYVYETEDQGTSGFYRFIPAQDTQLSAGGRLQMMKLNGTQDVRRGIQPGQEFDVSWVEIADPERAHSPGSRSAENPDGDELGVFMQGKAQGGATFARLEGCFYKDDLIILDSTSGGDSGVGQIWQYDPRNERLKLLFESPSKSVLDSPDNLTVSPRGGIVLCEDGDVLPHRVHCLTPEGRLFTFCENHVLLNGEKNGFSGDFRNQEWAGATFTPDGNWLLVNIQTPGMTLAITGPWGTGLL